MYTKIMQLYDIVIISLNVVLKAYNKMLFSKPMFEHCLEQKLD